MYEHKKPHHIRAQVMTIADYLFEGFDLAWMHPEFRSNLGKELDFINEGRNGERCARLFK